MRHAGAAQDPGAPPAVTAALATSYDELRRVKRIFAAVWPRIPPAHGYRPPDARTSYVLVRVRGMAVGAVRIVWRADVAELEKISILPGQRGVTALRPLFETAVDVAKTRGCRRVEAWVRKHHRRAWQRFGAVPSPIRPRVVHGAPACQLRFDLSRFRTR